MSKLREAVELDKQNFKNKKPAIEKLKLLPIINKFLSNIYYQEIFLDSDGLELLQEWVKKNKDGTYPLFNQLNEMLDILASMNISIYNLKNCSIGGNIMEISKNLITSKTLQKKATDLVNKWSRIDY